MRQPTDSVRTAIIPAAGIGSRLTPLTNAVPKCLVAVGELTALDLVLREIVACGIDHLVIVCPPSGLIEQHLLTSGVRHDGSSMHTTINDVVVKVSCPIQSEPRGLGDAILCGLPHVVDQEFTTIVLPDVTTVPSNYGLAPLLSEHYKNNRAPCISVRPIAATLAHAHGVATLKSGDTAFRAVLAMTEKPRRLEGAETLILAGRYVLRTRDLLHLQHQLPDAGGEVQLTDTLSHLLNAGRPLYGLISTSTWIDMGTPTGLVDSVIRLAAQSSTGRAMIREALVSRTDLVTEHD